MVKGPSNITISIDSGTIVRVILFALLITFLYFFRELALVLLTAVLFAAAIEPATRWFMQYKIPRIVSVIIIYATLAIFILGLFYFFLPPVLNEASNFLATVPQHIDALDVNVSNPLTNTPLIDSQKVVQDLSLREVITDLQKSLTSVSEGFLTAVSTVFGGILGFILIVVFSFYFAVQETGIQDFLKVITPIKRHKYILDLWRRSQIKIGRWMQGQLLLGLIIGVLVYLMLTILGVPYALLLAILAALFELIPVFGPVLAAIPAVAVGFISGGATLGLIVIGSYIIIQQFENHLIYPLVVTKVVGVPPLLVILALIIGAKLAGFLGIILSVPVAAIIQEFVGDVQKEKLRLAKEGEGK